VDQGEAQGLQDPGATILRNVLREYDLCARWGGEEFLILLPGTNQADAAVVAEKVRDRVAGLVMELEGRRLSYTISMGVTGHCRGEDQGTLLQRADQARYEAKRLGGDRVVLAAEPS
jgi:diguanylate cyclase (GGDEF)-like protein